MEGPGTEVGNYPQLSIPAELAGKIPRPCPLAVQPLAKAYKLGGQHRYVLALPSP